MLTGGEGLLALLPGPRVFPWSVGWIKRLHATRKPFVYYERGIDTPLQRAPLRIAIGRIRMGSAETGWGKDSP